MDCSPSERLLFIWLEIAIFLFFFYRIFLLRVLLVVWVELSHTPEMEIIHLPQSCAVTQPSHLTHLVAYLLKTQHKWYQKAHTFKYLLNISMGLQI